MIPLLLRSSCSHIKLVVLSMSLFLVMWAYKDTAVLFAEINHFDITRFSLSFCLIDFGYLSNNKNKLIIESATHYSLLRMQKKCWDLLSSYIIQKTDRHFSWSWNEKFATKKKKKGTVNFKLDLSLTSNPFKNFFIIFQRNQNFFFLFFFKRETVLSATWLFVNVWQKFCQVCSQSDWTIFPKTIRISV